MLNQIRLSSIVINSPRESLVKIITDNLNPNLINWTITQNEVGNIIYIFTDTYDSLGVGNLVVKRLTEESSELVVMGSIVEPEDDNNDDRLFIIRKAIENLFFILQKEKSLSPLTS